MFIFDHWSRVQSTTQAKKARLHGPTPLTIARFAACRRKKLSADKVNSTIDVYTKEDILKPVALICCTFMPNIDEARLIGMKTKARTVTVQNGLVNILDLPLQRFETYEKWHSGSLLHC
jgi:hypothetical protein